MEIILVVGLPGSGKSTRIQKEYSKETTYSVFDDVKSRAVLNCGNFTYSRHYPGIVNEMKNGSKNIVISDISFCDCEQFCQAYEILNWWITEHDFDYKIKSVIFKNEPEKCIRNINRSNNRNNHQRIEMVRKFSPHFDPDGMMRTDDDCIIDVYGK